MPFPTEDRGGPPVNRPPVNRNIASLVGGFVIAAGVLVLWLLVALQLSHGMPPPWAVGSGVVFAVVVGVWIRIADL